MTSVKYNSQANENAVGPLFYPLSRGPPERLLLLDLSFNYAPELLRTILQAHGKLDGLQPGSRIRVVKCALPHASDFLPELKS